jgi:hypothetical protein
MFFNDLGCFEIESQSFTRVEASSKASTNKTSSTKSNSSSSASKSAEGGGKTKKNMKPLVKKRSNCAALDPNQPKPRTPRRKLNCGNAFEDLDLANFSSVGTPSNFNAEVHHMWGHELDFAGSYVDTFLDLPTPKSAEMPTIGVLPYNAARELEQPKLIRTNSIEQEGLSHFFEQTHLGSSSSYPPTKATTLLKPNKTIKNKSKNTKSTTASVGIMEAVDQVFGSTTSTTTGASTSTNATSTTTTTGGRKNSSGTTATKRSKATTKSKKANVAASKGGDFNFDHKNMPEFESLLEEYKLADIDQDLDSFYMDTLESFGGELDLISA